ncbi:MAG: ATP-dependent Clp protease proteolytic subunit [Clostridia bacterium]|nr:ATP-dependent Clp protease proteolytic subunit [Clostridia bacterium]
MIFNPSFYSADKGGSGKDLYSKLLDERKILLFNEVNDDLACSVIAQLLYLEAIDPDKDITVYINSPGGSVSAGFGIYDTMRKLKCDVSTVCTGMAASMGAFLLAAGTKGKRYATENSEIMIHQVLGGTRGPATDIEIEAKHMQLLKERLNKLLAQNTGHTVEQIEADTDRNNWMFPEEAVEYGIIDAIV